MLLVVGIILTLQVAYQGKTSKVLQHFSHRGLECTLHYNPADFMCKSLPKDFMLSVLLYIT